MNSQEWRLIDRFKEPSSWASLAALSGTVGIALPQGWVQTISLFGAAVCCLLGVVLKEGKNA